MQAGVPDLLCRQAALVPLAHRQPLRLVDVGARHLARQGLEPRVAELGPAERLRRDAPQLHRVGDHEAAVLGQPPNVAVDRHAEEAVAGAGEEVPEGDRDAVGVEDLEDEAAAAHAELQDGHPVPGAAAAALRGDDAPLGVDADQELLAVPAADDLAEEGLDGVAGGRDGGPDHGAVVHDDVGVVRALHHRTREGFRWRCCLDQQHGRMDSLESCAMSRR